MAVMKCIRHRHDRIGLDSDTTTALPPALIEDAMSSLDSDNPHISVAVGITIGLVASFIQSLGLTIQRKSHIQNQLLPQPEQRVEHRRPLWLLGFGIFISSNILGSLFQIASLPVVILAPLGAVSLLWNAFFARLLLGDVFSPWMFLGTILIAGGAVLIAVFGIVPEPTHSLEDLLELFRRPAFIVYFSLLGVAVTTCLVITHVAEYSLSQKPKSPLFSPPSSPRPLSPVIPSLAVPPPSSLVSTTEHTPLLDRKPPASRSSTPGSQFPAHGANRTPLFIALSYASASGILSGMCLIFAKSGIELLMLSIGGANQFWRWESWVLLLGLVVFALLQLWYLHKGLVFADPTIVCPLAFCFYNLSSIVNGLVYFDQVGLLTTLQLLLVSLGIIILLGGVWLVSFHAGGGGVDVGTWQEGDVDAESIEEHRPLHERVTTNPAHLETADESSVPSLGRFSMTFPRVHSPPQSPGNAVEDEDAPMLGRPKSKSRTRSRRAQPRFSFLGSVDTPAATSGPTLNLPGGGFSIGLSPVSPGFALVPKRRVSGFRSIVRRAAMRRTLSEGDVTSVDGANGDGRDGAPTSGTSHDELPHAPDRRAGTAKARWKWLREIFADGQGRGSN